MAVSVSQCQAGGFAGDAGTGKGEASCGKYSRQAAGVLDGTLQEDHGQCRDDFLYTSHTVGLLFVS